ncbi:MAG: 30S ribosomal protein S12 methylthiotransferase RimO [Proteobacteria bacterium]|nr:30S ribosomal protein S12 methylthiotransferase RimO [Pseudomonadota bacterium]
MPPSEQKARVHFHSLGCPKNQLDTEVMLGALALDGYAIAEELEDADVAIVNTCSFIESAREESIQAILDVADLRDSGRLRALVVTGCLPQRYGDELARELPEVDAFVGTGRYPEVPGILEDVFAGRSRGIYVDAGRTHLYDHTSPRILIGGGHSAYVKTSEGCDRVCTFCAIPGIRGRFQSRTLESLVAECRDLARAGVKEVNLVAQDQTSWGKDLPGRPRLHSLLRGLDDVDGLAWIRLLYLYPTAVSDELIETLAAARRVLPYVDVPLQHASDGVLKAMRRGVTAERQWRLVERLRAGIPDLTLRTTFIVGFPGETDADFEALLDFARAARFDRVGVFRYSDEEGTAAQTLGRKVPRELARERHRTLLEVQRQIMAEKQEALVGSEVELLVEHRHMHGVAGRTASQAPEIDGGVFAKGSAEPGELVRARVLAVRDGVDLEAEVV